jgi:hypothetical protein
MKNKKKITSKKNFWFLAMILVVILILGITVLLSIKYPNKTTYDNKIKTIKLSIKDSDFAYVYVVNGSIDVEIINRGAYKQIQILSDSINEINKNETLPLIEETEPGNIAAHQVSKNDSDYIYALADYLGNKGFKTEVTYREYELKPGKVLWSECEDAYDKIDSDLQNANYCENDSDCVTLPLAGSYIEFGCYHYINKKENSTLFYDRMNEYSAVCGQVIDMCRQVPDSKCTNGKCVEAE